LKNAGLHATLCSTSQKLEDVDAVVLPGVGNFGVVSQKLQPFKRQITRLVDDGVPLLGVCLGMQLLFQASEEAYGRGLGLLEGQVLRLPKDVKKPHMGWNTLRISRQHQLVEGVNKDDYFYFVHSYYTSPVDEHVIVAETEYNLSLPSVVADSNVYGTQFHPEKSGSAGQRILRNFAEVIRN